VSSRVAVVEVSKAVARMDPAADPAAILGQLTLIDLDPELARSAAATGGPGLRALDAIHVASALRVATDIEAFVTYDARQAAAAHAVGLRVVTPRDDLR
jgi:predicted nucleic acid-binding protein